MYSKWKKDYLKKRSEIMKSNLTDFEKQNAIRGLAGLEPLTIHEYNEQLTYYKQ